MAKKKGRTPKASPRVRIRVLIAVLSMLILILTFQLYFLKRIYPGVYVAGIHLVGLTKEAAQERLLLNINSRLNQGMDLHLSSQSYQLDLKGLVTKDQIKQVVSEAFLYGHTFLFLPKVSLEVPVDFTPYQEAQINSLENTVLQPAVEAQIKLSDGVINVTPSQDGLALDKVKLKIKIMSYLNSGQSSNNLLPTQPLKPKLSYAKALKIKKSLDQIKATPLTLTFKDQRFILDQESLLNLIDLSGGKDQLLDPDKLKDYLKRISLEIDRVVKEPLFNFDGQRVTEFQPPQEGYKLDINHSAKLINSLLTKMQTTQLSSSELSTPLIVDIIPARNKLTNDLGIKELLGEGFSRFSGSITNRIYNISLAASRINGVLISPDETFSFNDQVGDISAASGYKQAYVIKSGRTVLDDGGGVCQVSTTLFRAILNSGLPIIARTAHAYRVGYYEQGFPPGLDATIFSPNIDFKFKNDTGHHVLIQSYVLGETLTIDLYGTSDGRTTQVSTPKILSQTPPLPELRQDEPTLPKGEIKQVDWPAWGAKVVFGRTVIRGEQTVISETFTSNYRPWQAVYLVGTKEN